MYFWDSCTEIDRERRPFPPCALRGFEFISFLFILCLVLIEFRFSFVDSWARVDGLILDVFVTLCSDSKPSSLVLNPRNHESPWIEVSAFLRKPQSCFEFRRFLSNHGVIRRFLPWTYSQVPCDHAYEIWWDLDLIWSLDHRVFERTRAGKRFWTLFHLAPDEPTLWNCMRRINRCICLFLS